MLGLWMLETLISPLADFVNGLLGALLPLGPRRARRARAESPPGSAAAHRTSASDHDRGQQRFRHVHTRFSPGHVRITRPVQS